MSFHIQSVLHLLLKSFSSASDVQYFLFMISEQWLKGAADKTSKF